MIVFAPIACKYALMNWDDLRFFLAAVRARTYSGAAAELGVNRTTVARRVGQLEQSVGRALFSFSGNHYQLTPAGEELYQHARELEHFVGGLEGKLGLEEEQLSGQLRIAASLGLGPEFVPELAALSTTYPQLQWELVNALDPIASLSQRKADVAIAVSNHCPAHLKGHYLGELQRAIYASKGYLKRVAADAELAQHHWIGWGRDLAQSQAAKWMSANLPATVQRPAEVNSWQALKAAVLAGVGVAHLWCFLADADTRLQRIRPATTELSMGLWLMRAGDMPANARARAFEASVAPALAARIGANALS